MIDILSFKQLQSLKEDIVIIDQFFHRLDYESYK